MDLLKFQASIDANTAATNRLADILEKAAGAGVSAAGEPAAARGPGRPRKDATAAPATTASSAPASVATTAPAQQSVAANQATATPSSGALTHKALVPKFQAYAKVHGRDGVVKLLGEFGVTEFGQVKADDLGLFQDRLDGKPQTPVDPSDVSNLLGLGT